MNITYKKYIKYINKMLERWKIFIKLLNICFAAIYIMVFNKNKKKLQMYEMKVILI